MAEQHSPPRAVGVIGGGTMGVGIAYVHAAAGSSVFLVEPDAARRDALPAILKKAAKSGEARGKLSGGDAARLLAGVSIVVAVSELPEALDLVVETTPENLDLKLRVIAAVGARRPGLIATNTSSIGIDLLAEASPDPARFLGMHFFNPVWSLPFVEIVRGRRTGDAAVETARRYSAAIGKETIVSQDVPGFATSRLDVLTAVEAIRMLEDGVASAEDIDKAMVTAFKHPVGPLKLTDIVGLDVRLDIATYLSGVLGERFAPPALLREKVARGELGVKSGRGFFNWPDARAFVSREETSRP